MKKVKDTERPATPQGPTRPSYVERPSDHREVTNEEYKEEEEE